MGEGANLTGSFHPSPWWRPCRRGVPPQVGRLAPGPSALMRSAGAVRAGPRCPRRAPDRHQPARDRRSPPATLATPGSRHRSGISTGSGPVLTRFGVLDRLSTSLDTLLMPGRRVRSRPCGPLMRRSAARAAITSPSGAPISPQRPATKSGAAQVADRSARGQPAIASSPARADRLGDPRHPPPPPPVSSRRGT